MPRFYKPLKPLSNNKAAAPATERKAPPKDPPKPELKKTLQEDSGE